MKKINNKATQWQEIKPPTSAKTAEQTLANGQGNVAIVASGIPS